MSVMACGRYGCNNIMCDRIMLGNYICHDCWLELVAHKDTWPKDLSGGKVRIRIVEFMQTTPGSHLAGNTDEAFEELTK